MRLRSLAAVFDISHFSGYILASVSDGDVSGS